MDESISPCFTLLPPPPKPWQTMQFSLDGVPMFWATAKRSTDFLSNFSLPVNPAGIPAAGPGFLYFPVVSWQTRQSILLASEKSKFASFQP
jgi:hypothetical protein